MKRNLFMLSALLLCAGMARAQVQPSLSLDFENGADGVAADGKSVAARVEGKAEFAAGKFGQALVSGPSSGYLHFPTSGIVRPEEGTVEMWVSPRDWAGTEQKFHVFFDAHGDGALYLYKFFNGGLLMLTAPDMAGPYRSATTLIDDWKPGEWHHIAATWSETQQHLYIDGKLVASANPSLPRRLDSEFMLGDNPWGEATVGARTSSSLIDRVRIYPRLLSAEHIAAHFAGDYGKVVPLSPQLFDVKYSLNAVNRVLSAVVESGGADLENNPNVTLEVLQDGKVLATRDVRLDGSLAKTDFDLAALPVGQYQLRARVAGNDALQVEKPLRLDEKPILDTSWRGNKIGLSPKIPPPWTPLRVLAKSAKGFSVACWGRTYVFGASPLPLQITSQSQPLLASPVALRVLAGGKSLQWTNGAAKIVSQSPDAVEIEGSARAAVAGGEVVLKTKIRLEYDGVAVVDLSMKAPPSFKPETVSLDVPVRESNALYRHRWTNKWEGFSGNVPVGSGVVETQDFTPFAWLGDNDRGLFWFCESGQFWPNYAAANVYETVRAPGSVMMRFNLLNGQALPKNWNYRFGLQATPVKPVPRNWRKWRMKPAGGDTTTGGNIDLIWPDGTPKAHKWFGYPEAADPKLFAARVKAAHARGEKVIPYSTMTQMWATTPEWLFFNREWNPLRVTEKTSATGVNYTPEFEWLLPTNRDYSDWMAWKHQQFLKDYKFDGYYLDQAHPYATTREEGGGWKDANGTWQPAYPILAYRDLYRRFYTMVKADNPNNFVMLHMSGKMGIPYLAYSDAYLDGENFREKFTDASTRYTDVLPLDAFRAEYMGRQWGMAPYFLPELWNEGSTPEQIARVAPARGLMALLLIHDVAVWNIWTNPQPLKEAFDALDSFGYVDADFIPYFDAKPPAKTAMKDVYISVYKRRDGRALAIVSNLSKEDQSGTVTFDASRIGVPLDNIVTWPGRKAVTKTGSAVTLSIPAQSWQMLLIGAPPASTRK